MGDMPSVRVVGTLRPSGELTEIEIQVGKRKGRIITDSPARALEALTLTAMVLDKMELPDCACEMCGDIDTCEQPQKYEYLAKKAGG